MSSRNKANVKKLFEFWCEVTPAHGVDRSTRAGAAAPAGVVLESFPESFRDDKTIADIPAFAFPCEFTCDSVQSYSFVLTTDDSKWRFGFCRHDPKTDSAMVIITYLPWHDTFLRLLSVLAELRRTNNDDFRTFLTETYQRGVPDPGGNLKLFYNGRQSCFVFERPLQFQLPSIPENNNLNLYYAFVEPKNMIAVFAAMLAERRIIFTSNRLDRLTSCIQAANAFLYPMVWQHIFIPVLPMKLKDYLSAPMPYLIGVPELVLETMTPDELGEVVILNCDKQTFESPFDDVHEMPAEIVSQLKKQLSHPDQHTGDRVSKIFLCVLVQLIGGYRDAVEFRDTGKSFNRDKFIETRPSHLRPFLSKMMELQIFQQFIDERIDMLNTGLGFSDEFELETVRYAEKIKKRGRNYQFLKNVKDKTNPAVKSAVKSVKEGSRGVKTAYKDLKSKFRDTTPPNNNNNNNNNGETHFRSHLSSNSQIDGFVVGTGKTFAGHHSAPSSPIFNKRSGASQHHHHQHHHQNHPTAGGFQYALPADINGASIAIRKAPPLAMSNSISHIQPNGYANLTPASAHHNTRLASSPTISPASSLCSSEMNLSQELQNHPLFKSPIVDRSLKPSSSLELNHRIASTRTGGQPPARPPPPMVHSLQSTPLRLHHNQTGALPPSYYNHPYVAAQQQQHQQKQQKQLNTKHYHSLSPAHVETIKPQSSLQRSAVLHKKATTTVNTNNTNVSQMSVKHDASSPCHTSTPNNKIIATETIFDNPPDMISPPVPPRRFGSGGANSSMVIAAGINKLQRNCWHSATSESKYAPKQYNTIELRNSSSSNSSTASALSSSTSASSSDHSFVSAASTFSHQPLCNEMTAALSSSSVPVPAPRLKKESLRSLQPHHLQVPHHHLTQSSLYSAASSSYASQEDTMNDLISLDDSNNTSFDLEDFDPLNQNARPLPICNNTGGKKSTTLPIGSSAALIASATTTTSISNPVYPYYTPQHTRPPLLPPTTKPPPPPTDMTSYDDDFELLRKYGLDQFTLTTAATTAGTTITTVSSAFHKSNGHRATPNSTTTTTMSNMNNWTTFD